MSETKIEGEKQPFGCDVADRHVTAIRYDGPEPEGLGTSEKLAIGAVAAGLHRHRHSEMSKGDGDAGASSEASAEQMRSCKNSVAEKFAEAAMADISVSSKSGGPNGEAEVAWTVNLGRAKTSGTCKVSADSEVLKVTTTGHSGSQQADGELEQDGFYYDKHVGKWRDEAGEICHTCTPENGFPKPPRRMR